MKKFMLLAIFILFRPSLLDAENLYVYGTVTGIREKTDTSSAPIVTYDAAGTYHLGREKQRPGGQYKWFKYRAFAQFSQGLPPDIVVDALQLQISFQWGQPTKSVKIDTILHSSPPSQYEPASAWTKIGSGGTIFAAITPTTSLQSFDLASLKSRIQGMLVMGTNFYMGFISNSENVDTADFNNINSVNLYVTYHREPSVYFVKNSFHSGQVRVDGHDTLSGARFMWLDGEHHVLRAIFPQSDPNFTYVWNDTGAAQAKSWWQIQRPGQNPIPVVQNIEHNYTSLKSDAGASLIADLKKVCTVYMRQRSEFGDEINLGSVATPIEGNPVTITAPAVMTVGGNTYPFASWSDGNRTNPRTFTATGYSYLVAVYKMHLASNNSYVTCAPNQHRICTYHGGSWKTMVYESGGQIWSSTSTSGTNFPSEVCISTGIANSNPSVVHTAWTSAYAVWEQADGAYRKIYFSKMNSGQWQQYPQLVATVYSMSTVRPVVGVYRYYNGEIHLGYTIGDQFYILQSNNDGNSWFEVLHFSNATSPSFDDIYSYFQYTFLNSSGIVYGMNAWNPQGWLGPYVIPGSNWVNFSPDEYDFTGSSCDAPQVRWNPYHSRIYYSWFEYQVVDYEHQYIVQQSKADVFSTVQAYEADLYSEVSPPTLSFSLDKIHMMWSEGNTIKKVAGDFSGGTWGAPEIVGTGKNPSLEISDLNTDLTYLSSQYVAPFTQVNVGTIPMSEGEDEDESGRLGKISLANKDYLYARVLFGVDTVTHQSFSIRMSQPTVGGKKLAFVAVNDTLPNIGSENLLDYFGTIPNVLATNRDTLAFDVTISSHGFNERAFSFLMKLDGLQNGRGIGNLFSKSHDLRGKTSRTKIKQVLSGLGGRSFEIHPARFSFRNLGQNWVFNLTHVYYKERPDSASKLAKTSSGKPTQFALANYPNPFNPLTTVKFDLPDESIVNLTVYDILGRKVADLANGTYPAGYHSVNWAAKDAASGIYFARFSATDVSGNQKFSKVTKLMLMK